MIPDKFNMVDMGGIDLIMAQGETIPGLYERLVESIAQCRYQCLYNWIFDGIVIPPTYVRMEIDTETGYVQINEGIEVDTDDVIYIHSLDVPASLVELSVDHNGVFEPPVSIEGFSKVTVNVQPVLESLSVDTNGTYTPDEGVDGFNSVQVNVEGGDAMEDLFVSSNDSGVPIADVTLSADITDFSIIFVESAFNHSSGIYCILTSMTDPTVSAGRFFANNAGSSYHNFYISGLRTFTTYNMYGGNWYIKHVFGIRK